MGERRWLQLDGPCLVPVLIIAAEAVLLFGLMFLASL